MKINKQNPNLSFVFTEVDNSLALVLNSKNNGKKYLISESNIEDISSKYSNFEKMFENDLYRKMNKSIIRLSNNPKSLNTTEVIIHKDVLDVFYNSQLNLGVKTKFEEDTTHQITLITHFLNFITQIKN